MFHKKYLRYLGLDSLFGIQRTKQILHVNPTIVPQREEAREVSISVYDYNATTLEKFTVNNVSECFRFKNNERISWINIDGLRKADVELVCNHFDIHPLLTEDILSI